ncbi:MAG: glycosyltransferase family 4 protein [Bacteroidetes bacterium]|nr:glycosyltransferase family 4 protein [Bacteroidota bacterium]
MKVLFVNHYGAFGGAQRSMVEMLDSFPPGVVQPVIVSPKGKSTLVFQRSGIPVYTIGGVSKFDHTLYGYYRGIRWLILLREFFYAFPTLWFFISKRKALKDVDLVHINEITCLLPMVLAKRILKKPVVVHARAVLNSDKRLWRTGFIAKLLDRYADSIIAIDMTVARSIPTQKNLTVVHNGLRLDGILSRSQDEVLNEKLNGIFRRRLTIGFIGNISPAKGIFELAEAVRRCVAEGMDVNLVIIGNNKPSMNRFLTNMLKRLRLTFSAVHYINEFIAVNGLRDHIHMIGFSTDLMTFYGYIDLLAFPSYYQSIGRPVFEAAFFYKPAVVAIEDPLPDTFIDGVTGLAVKAKDAASLQTAIRKMYDYPDDLIAMGKGAYQLARANFDSKVNSAKVLELYKSVLSAATTTATGLKSN